MKYKQLDALRPVLSAVGLLAVVAAREAGARRVILAGRAGDEPRLRIGQELGADEVLLADAGDPVERLRALNQGRLATRVIEATGASGAIELGVSLLGRAGVLVTVGGQRPEVEVRIRPGQLVNLQLEIRGTQLGGNNYEACLGVLNRGAYPFSRLVTHRFALPNIQQALETFEQRGTCIKPVLVFD